MSVSGRRTTSPGQTGPIPGFVPPSDEGKLSVAFDFGESLIGPEPYQPCAYRAHRYHVLGCGKLLGQKILLA